MKKNPDFIKLLEGIKENSNSYEDLKKFFIENYPTNQNGFFKFEKSRSMFLITLEDFDFAIDSHKKFKSSTTDLDIEELQRQKEEFLKNNCSQRVMNPIDFYHDLERDLLYGRKFKTGIREKIREHIRERLKPLFENNPIEDGGTKNSYFISLEHTIFQVFSSVRSMGEQLTKLNQFDLDKELDLLKEEN